MHSLLGNYLLGYIANGGLQKLNEVVLKALIKLVCLIIKLAWFDTDDHQEVIQQLCKFLQVVPMPPHYW